MNIIAIGLALAGTIPGLVVMCKILTVAIVYFECACVKYIFLGRDLLLLVLIIINLL